MSENRFIMLLQYPGITRMLNINDKKVEGCKIRHNFFILFSACTTISYPLKILLLLVKVRI